MTAACTCARLSGDPGSYPCPVHPEFGAATVAGPVKSESAGRPLPAPGMTDLMVTPEAIDAYLEKEPYAASTCPECGTKGEHGLGCPAGPYPLAGETMGSVSPCFVNCGEPACLKLGCVRVYNERHRNDREVRAWNGD